MIRANPHLSYMTPNCTYGQVLAQVATSDKGEYSEENLLKLEARIEELQRELRLPSRIPKDSVTPLDFSSRSLTGAASPWVPTPSAPTIGNSRSQPEPLAEPSVPISAGYDSSSHGYNQADLPIIAENWPLELPPRPLMLHLIDLFFTCYSNSRRIIHRPTFMAQLLEHPSSPRFPFIPLLHSICAAAAIHSPHVTVAPLPDLSKYLAEDTFQNKTRIDQARDLAFDEQHYILSRYQSMAASREGTNLLGVIQACIINSWWAFSCARWFDVWIMNSFAMRMCVALGLDFEDSLYKPLLDKAREKLLIAPPTSHIDVELRRNVFWLMYCLERYYLFFAPWGFDINDDDIQQTLPATLEAFELGIDDGQGRQNIFSADLFSTHYNNQDDFAMYTKCAVMLSRINLVERRQLLNYTTSEEVRDSGEMKSLESMINLMRLSLKKQFNPAEQLSTSAISNTFIAHMTPLASIKLHINIANWEDSSCDSANKALSAARGILRYSTMLGSTSFDITRLDRVVCPSWISAGKALVYSLKFAPESLAPILRAEIRLVRNNLQLVGDRIIIFLRQLRSFDVETVEILGEREAAKIFEGDIF